MTTKLHHENITAAEKLSDTLSALSDIQAVLLYGSIAKGYSDQYSDIDLILICKSPHRSLKNIFRDIQKLLKPHKLNFKEQELNVLQFDQYPHEQGKGTEKYKSYRAQISVQIEKRSVDTTIRLVSLPVVKGLAAAAKKDTYKYQTLVQYIIDTKTLFDRDGSFDTWKKSISSFKKFSPKLHAQFIKDCIYKADYYIKGEIPDSIRRQDVALQNYEMSKCIILLLNLLYAINDRCLAYPKWEHREILELSLKPKNFQVRLENLIRSQDPASAQKLLHDLKSFL